MCARDKFEDFGPASVRCPAKINKVFLLYSTCASPVVPHPSTRHAHGCLASEIGRDPAFPARYDRTGLSPVASNHTTTSRLPSREPLDRDSRLFVGYMYIYPKRTPDPPPLNQERWGVMEKERREREIERGVEVGHQAGKQSLC